MTGAPLELRLDCPSPEATVAAGARLGALLEAGDFLALSGELGAGKTTFSRGLAAGLRVRDAVASPSYLLCHEYDGPVPMLHLDAYFDQRMDGVLAEGLVERFAAAVVVAEWAERMADWLPTDRLEIRLSGEGEQRELRLQATGPVSRQRLEAFQALPELGISEGKS